MKRHECFDALARQIDDDDIVVATYSSAVEWNDLHPRVLNYLSMGAMGLASSHALGLALANPDRRVIVLDGDGSLLMNLGTLVTIGGAAPNNLVHFVCNNGAYEANGGHPIANQNVDFTGLAKSAGYKSCHDFSELASFEQQIGHLLGEKGPVFATLRLEKARPLKYEYTELYSPARRAAIKAELRKAR
jgi:phosphonopyruvate decarboxylase